MNRRSSAETAASALKATLAFVEREIAPDLQVQSALFQVRIRIQHSGFAMRTDDAHQPLGEDAVQRGNEVIQIDADIQKTSQHVKHVVGVDSGEDQVASESGVDGDLGSLLVT